MIFSSLLAEDILFDSVFNCANSLGVFRSSNKLSIISSDRNSEEISIY